MTHKLSYTICLGDDHDEWSIEVGYSPREPGSHIDPPSGSEITFHEASRPGVTYLRWDPFAAAVERQYGISAELLSSIVDDGADDAWYDARYRWED